MSKPLGNRRVTGTEQFYTPQDLAHELVIYSAGIIPDFSRRKFLEPAGGSGSFIRALSKEGIQNIQSVDLYPKFKGVARKNFLDYRPKNQTLSLFLIHPLGETMHFPFHFLIMQHFLVTT